MTLPPWEYLFLKFSGVLSFGFAIVMVLIVRGFISRVVVTIGTPRSGCNTCDDSKSGRMKSEPHSATDCANFAIELAPRRRSLLCKAV